MGPKFKSLIVELEKTQKLAARIGFKDWTSPYAILLKRLNLPTLQSRRTYIKLSMVYRIRNEDRYFPPGIFVQELFWSYKKLQSPPTTAIQLKYNIFYMFLCSTCSYSMELPPTLCDGSPSLTSFKHALSYVIM